MSNQRREPAVAVVVATHNRAHLLPRLVTALEQQRNAPAFEVVVVDDGSVDDTPAVLAALSRSTPLDLRGVRLEHNRGPAAARNAGWRATEAPAIAFTDDDCVPQPAWLASLVSGLAGADIAQGRTVNDPDKPFEGPFSWAPETREESGFYETYNIAYRRDVLEKAGGFDEQWRLQSNSERRYRAPVWGEDTDLALRVKKAGGTTTFVRDALAYHDGQPGAFRDRLADIPRRGGVATVVKRHPEFRTALYAGLTIDKAHARLLLAFAGVLVALVRPRRALTWVAAAALGAYWARLHAIDYPARAWHRVLPKWLVIDSLEIGVLARASVRNRTLVL